MPQSNSELRTLIDRLGPGLKSAHLRDAHRDCGDSTDNVRVLWVANMSGLLSRLGRGKKNQLAAVHLAPAAHIRISKLHKIDWSLEFVVPAVGLDLPLPGVDLYKRTGPQHWVKCAVFDPDISVKGIPPVHVLEQRDRNLAPTLKHPRDQVGTSKVDFLSEFQRGHECTLRASERGRHQVGVW